MAILTFESATNNRADEFIQKNLPKILVGILLLSLIYLIKALSDKIAFIFDSNISIRNFSSLSFNYYFLCIATGIFLVLWLFILSRSILMFFQSKFPFDLHSPKLELLFKINVMTFAFATFVLLNYFMPKMYLLLGFFTIVNRLLSLFSLNAFFMPSLLTYTDFLLFSSSLLSLSVEILGISSFIFFLYHMIYFMHKRVGFSDFLSQNYTFEVGSAFFYFFSLLVIFYLMIWYNLLSDVTTKILLLLVILTLSLWIIYKLTSTFYYGLSNSWVYSENSVLIYVILLIVFFAFPVIFWFIHDFIYLYMIQSTKYTILADFKPALISTNLVPSSIYEKPWLMNPLFLFVLTMVGIQRILLVDVVLVALFTLAYVSYIQLMYFITYFKSSFNAKFKEQLEKENNVIYTFNKKLKDNIVLKVLFLVFVVFIAWDVLLVVYSYFIMPLDKSLFPDISNAIIVTQLIDYIKTMQYPINYFGILLLILLFITVLIILNIVSIKLNENRLEQSFTGVYTLLTTSFIIIVSYLIYDLQNFQYDPLGHFQLIQISTYVYLTGNILLFISIYSDTFLLLIIIALVVNRIRRQSKERKTKPKPDSKETETTLDEEPLAKAAEEIIEEENVIRDVDY